MLRKEFPNKMQEKFNLTGVYIAIYDQAFKIPKEENNALDAHYNKERSGKHLTYIGVSDNHQYLFKKELPKDNSITYRLVGDYNEDVDQDPDMKNLRGEDELAGTDESKSYIYVDDVIKEKKLHYFKLPKLGCYMAIPLTYKSCLNGEAFTQALKDKVKYDKLVREQDL